MDEILLVPARREDVDEVRAVLREAARWMRVERGVVDQWPEEFPARIVEEAVDLGELYLVRLGDRVVGTVRVQDRDPAAWPDEDEPAVYVHSLAIRRSHAGRGLGAAVLAEVQATAAGRAVPRLRLDCVATNSALRRYYERLGFGYRGDVIQQNGSARWTSSRYERLAGDAPPPRLGTRVVPIGQAPNWAAERFGLAPERFDCASSATSSAASTSASATSGSRRAGGRPWAIGTRRARRCTCSSRGVRG